jgi:hypothetical protein
VVTIRCAYKLGGLQKADDEKTSYKEGVPLYEMNRLQQEAQHHVVSHSPCLKVFIHVIFLVCEASVPALGFRSIV